MKKIYLYIIALAWFSFSCNDTLDLEPLDKFSDASVWSDPAMVEVAVNNTYRSFETYKTGGLGPSACTDDVLEQHGGWFGVDLVVQATQTPDNAYMACSDQKWWWGDGSRWNKYYKHIKEVNTFFENIDQTEGDEELINRLKGEMYFMRAYAYSHLINYFGGVPIIEKVYGVDDTEFDEVRQPYQTCVDYMIEQLDKAIPLLPDSYTGDDIGRVTKGAAMALKARQLLYAASPLFNGATFADDYTDGSYDNTRLQAAKTATKALLDLSQYSLYQPDEYRKIFVDKNNSEIILARYYNEAVQIDHENRIEKENGPNGLGGWGAYNPLQQLVDQFEMADGSKFDWNNPVHAANPYEGRELRFYQSIYHDGSMYNDHEIETFIGGIDSPESPIEAWNASETGYYLRKFIDEDFDWSSDFTSNFMWVMMRLSEFYLNYAEILCELGETSEALNWINPIRERAQLPNIETTDQAELRAIIRHERQVELCFEGRRFFDVRRWGIYQNILSDARGIYITKAEDGTKTYDTTKVVQTRRYDPKSYFISLPRTELQKNSNLVNNPGFN